MKRTLTGLVILLAAVALLAGLLWMKSRREGAALRAGAVFDTTRISEVHDLRIGYLRDSTRLLRLGGRWVTARDTFPVDTARMGKVLRSLLGLREYETVTDSADAQSLWDYGLNPEDAKRVEWTWSDGSKEQVLLGKTSTLDFSFVYWMRAGSARVFRTPGSFIWDVSPRTDDWREKAFWPAFAASDIDSLTVAWKDASGGPVQYRVARTASKPLSAAAQKLFEKATQFTADDFGTELDPNRAAISLADPAMTIRIHLNDGTEHILRAGPVFMGLQYTQHPAHRNLVWVFKWRYDYFRKTPEALIQ
jgi:hypothetical protein